MPLPSFLRFEKKKPFISLESAKNSENDQLLPNVQPIAVKEEDKRSSKPGHHAIPSSLFTLNDKEKEELRDVLLNIKLVELGLMSE